MRLVSVTVFLVVLSVGQLAPLHQSSCDRLIRPLENQGIDQMVGKWIKIGDSIGNPLFMTTLKRIESTWFDVSVGQNSSMTIIELVKMNGRCMSVNYNATFENGSVQTESPIAISIQMLHTDSSDCFLLHLKAVLGRISVPSLQLSCKGTNVPLEELNIYRKQAECLKLPPPLFFKSDADLCPDPNAKHQDTEVIDLCLNMNQEQTEKLKILVDSGRLVDLLEKHANSSTIPLTESA